jgi:hypothetical protein
MHTTQMKLSEQIDLFAPIEQQVYGNAKNSHVERINPTGTS